MMIHFRTTHHQHDKIDEINKKTYDDFVRLERRNLLITSFISIFLCISNVDTSKLNFVGIQFDKLSNATLLITISLLTLYFLIMFIISMIPYYRTAKKEWHEILKKLTPRGTNSISYAIKGKVNSYIASLRFQTWIVFNYLFPIFLALLSFVLVLLKLFTE